MSDSSSDQKRKRPDRRAANINSPSFRKHAPQEEGLWNLDEEWQVKADSSPAAQEEKNEPAAVTSPPEPGAPAPEMTDAASAPQAEETVTRVEPSYSRRRLTRNKRRSNETEEPARSEDEVAESPIPPFSPETPEPMEASTLRNSAPVGLGLTEDEVWSDFLSDDELAPNGNNLPSALAPHEKQPEPEEPAIKLQAEPEPEENDPLPHREELAEVEKENDLPVPEPMPSMETTETELIDERSSEENNAGTSDTLPAQSFSFSFPVLSRFEIIASFLFLLCLLFGGIWTLQVFRSEVQAQPNPYLQPDYPSVGNLATVASADTFWRVPVTEGANADPVRQDVTLIPVIRIKLGTCASPSGAIRVIFYNDKGIIAGDTVTHRFENHQFSPGGSSERAFAATTGFTNFGDQEAYRAHLVKPWTIRVYEGPDENAPSSQFRLLFTAPISTYIQ